MKKRERKANQRIPSGFDEVREKFHRHADSSLDTTLMIMRKRMSREYVAFSFFAIVSCLAITPPNVISGTGNAVGYGELKEEWRGEM